MAVGSVSAWEKQGHGPRVYLSAGIHGDEPAGPLALLELLKEDFFTAELHWVIRPALNPTGLHRSTRENDLGIDLNRDYWRCDTPETTSHVAWLLGQSAPDLFISLHEDWETSGFYFYEINLQEDRPERAHSILKAVSGWFHAEVGPEIDGHEVGEDGWINHASDPDLPEAWPEAIFLAKLGCPLSFTLETPSCGELSSRIGAHKAAIRAICDHAFDDNCSAKSDG